MPVEGTKDDDLVQTVNLGPMGAWNFMNHSPDWGMSIRALATIFMSLNE